jgi:hypothetical protein
MRISALVLVLVACSHAKPVAKAPPPDDGRFDFKVRQDFFDGLRGDAVALERAMKICEDALAKNPNDAEAMVWHGAGVASHAVVAFRTGDMKTGLALWTQGLTEMDRAVALAPNRVGVRIPRGAVLFATAPHVPEPQRTQLVRNALADYEATLAVQEPYFTQLTLHSREQLLYGLTDGYAMLGDLAKAQATFTRMQRDAAGSEILARAEARSRGDAVEGQTPCEQCHAR